MIIEELGTITLLLPSQWITFLIELEKNLKNPLDYRYKSILSGNSLLDKATLKPRLSLIEGTLIQRSQLPQEYVTL